MCFVPGGAQQVPHTDCHVLLLQWIITEGPDSLKPQVSGIAWNETAVSVQLISSFSQCWFILGISQKHPESRACWKAPSRREHRRPAGTTQPFPWATRLHSPTLVLKLPCILSFSDQLVLCPKPKLQRKLKTYISKGRTWESALVPYRVT